MNAPRLQSFRLKNFKAVRDSGVINFTPLTVFIGGNGSGKSSIIEGLEMLHIIATDGLDRAMQAWRGFEHIANKGTSHELVTEPDTHMRPYYRNAMSFSMRGRLENKTDIS